MRIRRPRGAGGEPPSYLLACGPAPLRLHPGLRTAAQLALELTGRAPEGPPARPDNGPAHPGYATAA
jgi:hypothetical protein